jgi:PmbA protein
MLEQLLASLERHRGIHDWIVRRRRSRGVQLYLVGRDVESQREVQTEEYEVEVFNDHPFPPGTEAAQRGERARGAAAIRLVPADATRLDAVVEDAVQMASLVHNPMYALAEPAAYPDVPLTDPTLETLDAQAHAAQTFAERVWMLVAEEPGVRLSAAELFMTFAELELRSSRGARGESTGTSLMSELVLLAGGTAVDEAESFRHLNARRLEDLWLEGAVPETAARARDTLRAGTPQTRLGPVILEGEALAPLFEAFVFQASGAAAYNKLSRFQIGETVCGGREARGDRLTLRANAVRPYGQRSHRFDGDGVAGQNVLLVDGGVLRARHATQRYAQYLGLPATGESGNVDVELGAVTADELAAGGGVYRIVAFSAPDVDPVTGDFGSEIRLGYELTSSGARPVKGGSVSGNVFEAFADARFSRELYDHDGYAGPRQIRFESLRVAGT